MTGQVKQTSEPATFADRLRSAMFEKGIGLGVLSRETGITQRQLVSYRNGQHEPRDYYGRPTANAHKIAEALGVPVDDLVSPRPHSDDSDLLPAA